MPKWRSTYSIHNFRLYPSGFVFKKGTSFPSTSTLKAYVTVLLNCTHDITGYNAVMYFPDVKALNYETGALELKHIPYSACSEALYLPVYIVLQCMSPWKLSTQAVSKFLHLVNKLSKQEFINMRCLPYFSGFTWITDTWWLLVIWTVAWNFSSGLILSMRGCEF